MEKLGAVLSISLLVVAGCSRAPNPERDLREGVAYLQEGKPAKAADCFQRALAIAPPTPQALNYLAVSQLQTGNPDAAVTNLLAALRLDDSYATTHYNLGVAYLETGHPNDAVTHLRQAARTADTEYYLGLAYAHLSAWSQASESLQHAIAHDPKMVDAYLNLAAIEQQHLARPKDAMLHYQKYNDLAPKSEHHDAVQQRIVEIAQQLETKPKPATVAAVVEKPVPPAPPKPVVVTPAPVPQPVAPVVVQPVTPPAPTPASPPAPTPPPQPVKKTRPPLSSQPLKAGSRSRANVYFTKAIQAHQANKLTAAIADYAKAISIDPSFAAAYYNLAIAYRAASQPEKALENYELALRAKPDYADARYNYAGLLQDQGYTDDAITQYEKFLQSNPNDAAGHLAVASIYARDHNTLSKAREHYQAFLRLAPNHALARDIRRWLDTNR